MLPLSKRSHRYSIRKKNSVLALGSEGRGGMETEWKSEVSRQGSRWGGKW